MFKRYYYNIYSDGMNGVYVVNPIDNKPFYIHSCHIKRIVYRKPYYFVVMRKSIDFYDPIRYKLPCKVKA